MTSVDRDELVECLSGVAAGVVTDEKVLKDLKARKLIELVYVCAHLLTCARPSPTSVPAQVCRRSLMHRSMHEL
ncbi:hypothetical protein EON66_07735 [archaeon]|nr:MAG: hypothetical protein EON66_07735 [archaeon]